MPDPKPFDARWAHVLQPLRADEARPRRTAASVTVSPACTIAWTTFSYTCDRCGSAMEEEKCKIVCRSCGYMRDCGDP